MRIMIAAAALAAAASPSIAETPASPALQRLMADRVAGEPVSCVRRTPTLRTRIVDERTVTFSSGSKTLFLTEPADCPGLKAGRNIDLMPDAKQFCENDEVAVIDLSAGVEHGICRLGKFTPWTRAAKGR